MKKILRPILFISIFGGLLFCISSCEQTPPGEQAQIKCDTDNGGLILPTGFCALIVADHISFLRHLTVAANGDIYGTRRSRRLKIGGLVAIRDTDQDGRAEIIQEFGDQPSLGIATHNGYLYLGENQRVLRYRLNGKDLLPQEEAQIVIDSFPEQAIHSGKSFAFDPQGQIYINLGSPSNACQLDELSIASAGQDPCPDRKLQAAIWQFDSQKIKQQFPSDGVKYASGIRNTYAINWSQHDNSLYAVQHGRDGLYDLWPDLYSPEQGAELPAEQFLQISKNDQFSWPYCYYDGNKKSLILAPEYGGDGQKSQRCENYKQPIFAFPAHYSPNDLLFYTGEQFPQQYRQGAFIAFHGSYNRGAYEQVGYQVVYVPFKDGKPTGHSQVFADGFSGTKSISAPEEAEHRPVGLALGPDGSLYIADSVQGRIWRVLHQQQE